MHLLTLKTIGNNLYRILIVNNNSNIYYILEEKKFDWSNKSLKKHMINPGIVGLFSRKISPGDFYTSIRNYYY
jgi:hypothetical protein